MRLVKNGEMKITLRRFSGAYEQCIVSKIFSEVPFYKPFSAVEPVVNKEWGRMIGLRRGQLILL